jgi:hypothetical protein
MVNKNDNPPSRLFLVRKHLRGFDFWGQQIARSLRPLKCQGESQLAQTVAVERFSTGQVGELRLGELVVVPSGSLPKI